MALCSEAGPAANNNSFCKRTSGVRYSNWNWTTYLLHQKFKDLILHNHNQCPARIRDESAYGPKTSCAPLITRTVIPSLKGFETVFSEEATEYLISRVAAFLNHQCHVNGPFINPYTQEILDQYDNICEIIYEESRGFCVAITFDKKCKEKNRFQKKLESQRICKSIHDRLSEFISQVVATEFTICVEDSAPGKIRIDSEPMPDDFFSLKLKGLQIKVECLTPDGELYSQLLVEGMSLPDNGASDLTWYTDDTNYPKIHLCSQLILPTRWKRGQEDIVNELVRAVKWKKAFKFKEIYPLLHQDRYFLFFPYTFNTPSELSDYRHSFMNVIPKKFRGEEIRTLDNKRFYEGC